MKLIYDVVRETICSYGTVNGPTMAANIFRELQLDNKLPKERESFAVLLLDAKHKVTAFHLVSIGTVNQSLVHPREVFRTAILENAAAVVVMHFHPSGESKPSIEDDEVTKRLKKSGVILGIQVLDHVIVTDEDYFSYRDNGLL